MRPMAIGRQDQQRHDAHADEAAARSATDDRADVFQIGSGGTLPFGIGPPWDQSFWSSNAAHDTVGCQFTNGPVELSFHAHTCSV